jgi:dihydroxy-acid dehydratase
MLYATEGVNTDADLAKPMIGVGSIWFVSSLPYLGRRAPLTLPPLKRYEGNPCNMHLLSLSTHIKSSLQSSGLIPYRFGAVGVSDGISMGTFGMSYSLQSRDLIADSVETAVGGHWLDGAVVVPGCDKNMPGVLMARSSFSLYSFLSHLILM